MSDATPLLVIGATGRIGRAMRRHGGALRPIWQARRPLPDHLTWDILTGFCPDGAAAGVVLCLAGVIRGMDAELAINTDLALAACRAAVAQGARHVFITSSAAVYGAGAGVLAEDAAPAALHPYGAAKAAMEKAVLAAMPADGPRLTILRIGNIAGMDALLGGLQDGVMARLDPVAGRAGGPIRSYIGPQTLARVLSRLMVLAAQGAVLPPVLNIAAGPVAMADLLDAAGAQWAYGPPNPSVIPQVVLDITRLQRLVDLPPDAGQAAVMVAEWRGAGA
jgi:nucleoside-diphosphate-sugar epimerase